MANREYTWRELRLGIIVASVLVVGGFVVLLAGAKRGPFLPAVYTLFVDVDDAAGIRAGSLVRVGGIDAGEVKNLEIVASPPQEPAPSDSLMPITGSDMTRRNIRLELSVHERYRANITGSSRAQLASIGAGGERYVRITPGDVREPPLPEGSEIPTVASVDLDLVLARLGRALNETREIMALSDEIRAKLDAGSGSLGRLLAPDAVLYRRIAALQAESSALAALLEEGEGLIPSMGRDPALAARIDSLVESAGAIAAAFDGGPAEVWVERTELDAALADLRTSVADVDRRLTAGEGTLGRLLNDPELRLQYRVLLARIAELARAVAADPLAFVNIELF